MPEKYPKKRGKKWIILITKISDMPPDIKTGVKWRHWKDNHETQKTEWRLESKNLMQLSK